MGIFKLFQGSIHIKKLFWGLKNIKLYLASKLLYQLPISGASATCGTVTYNGNKQIAQDINVKLSGCTLIDDYDYIVTSNSGGTNAGSYQFTVSGINYFNSSVNGTFTINPKTVNSPTITLDPSSYTYNGSQCKPTPTVKDGSTVIPSSEYTVTYSDNTNAGTATCTITDKSGGNYTVSGSKTFTISKADISPTVSIANWTYGGTASNPSVSGNSGGGTVTYYYKLTSASSWSTTKPSNAGDYNIRADIAATTNYNSGSCTNTFTIGKADPSYTAPTAKSLTYNGSAQALLNAGAVTGGTIYYSSDNSTWATTIPSGTNASNYTSYWKITGDSNHKDKASASITTTISKASGSVSTKPTAKTLTYNGSAQALVTAGSGTGTMMYKLGSDSWSTSIPSSTNAGDYTVYYKASASTNYNESASGSVSVGIAKVTPTVTAPTAKSLTYNGNPQTLADTGSTNWGTLQYSLDGSSYSTSVPSSTNAGSYTVYYKVVGNSNINDVAAKTIACSIAKANPTYTAPTKKTGLVYNGSAQNLLNAGSTSHGTIQYSSDGSSWSATIPTGTNASSTYKAYWRLVGDSNHKDVASTEISSISIAKVTPTVTAPTPKTLTFNNANQVLANAGSTNYGTIQYCLNSSGGTYSTSVPSASAANTTYKVWYKVVGNSNVNDVAPASIDCMIAEKRVTTPTIVLDPSSYTYNGTARQPSVTVKDGTTVIPSSEYTVGYSNNTNAGTATVTITDKDAGNYYISGTTTFTISKVTPTVTAPTAKSLTYNGNPQALVNAGSTNFGSLQYCTTSGGTYSTTIPTQTNAGSYEVWYKVVGDSNVNSTNPTKVACSIAKAAGTATVGGTSNTYNGSAKNLVTVSSNTGTMHYKVDSGGWSTTLPQATNAGSWTIYWYMDASDNYTGIASASTRYVTSSIAKAAMTYTAPKAAVRTYNGNAQEIVSGASVGGGSIYYATSSAGASSSTTVPTQVNASTTYSTWWKAVPDSNHSGGTSSWTQITGCTINKANQSAPTATGATTTYHNTATATANGGGGVGTLTWTNGNTRTATGTTTTAAYWSGNDNYNASPNSNSVNLVVNKATDQSITVTTTDRTYSTSAQVVASATSHGISSYYLGFGSSSTSAPTTWGAANSSISQTNAGTYYIWYKGTADGNHSADIGATYKGTITIAKANQTAPTATGSSVTYGNTATAKASGGGGQGSIEWSNGSTLTGNVGSKTTKARWSGNSNYNASPWSSEVTLAITKADGSVTINGVSLTYNGSARNLATVSNNTGTMHYSTNGTSWVTTIPTATNANSYTVYWYMDASTNYNGIASASSRYVSSSIAKADQSAPTATGATTTYSTTATATAGGGGQQGSIEWSNGNTQTSVGSKTTKARWSGNSNYNASPWSNEVTVKMDKASQNAPTATGGSATYPSTATATAGGGGKQGSIEWYNGSSRSAIGSQTTKARWSGNGNYNASPYSNEVTLSIAKFTPTVTLSATDRAYNGNPLYATASVATPSGGKTMKGTIYYGTSSGAQTYSATYGGSGSVNLSSVSVTNVGSATVYAYFVPDSTCSDVYNNSGNVSKTFSVSKANQSAPTATGATTTYHNTATATASGGGGVGTLTWTNGNTRTATGTTTTAAYWSGNGNYNASPNSNSVNLVVNKATDQSVTVTLTNRTYNGNGQVVASASSHGCTYYLGFGSSSTSAPTSWGSANSSISQTNAGTYYVWYKGTADGNHSSDIGATYKGSVTIGKADQSAPTAAGATTTYPTTATASASGGGGVGSIEWSNGNTQTSVGSKTTKARWSGNSNYNASPWSSEVTVKMNKAGGSVSTAPVNNNYTYNGTARAVASAGSGTGTMYYRLGSSGSFSTTMPTMTDAGSNTLYYYAAESTNYTQSSTGSITVSVQKASQSAPTATVTTATYPGTSSASASGGGGVGTLTWTNGSSRSTVGTQDTYAYWSGNSNYNASPNSNKVTLSVAKFTPTVTLSATNRAYNGNALYATASVGTPSGGKTMKGTIYYGTSSGAKTYSVTYTGGSVNLSSVSVTNVGSATVYAYFVPDSTCSDVYNNSGNVSKTFSVSKANQSAPTATGATVSYHNTATATASGGGGQGTLSWTNGSSRSTTGSQDTYAYWAGNSNYNASPNSNKVTLTVNKATDQSVSVTLTNRTYNGNGQVVASASSHGCTYYLGFGGSSTSAPSSWGSANSSISQTNAGTYYVWYKGTADGNHSSDIGATYKGSVTIGKADQSAPTATGATTTYPTGATASASGGGGVGTLTWTNGSSRSSCGSQSTKAYWSGNSNYNASPYSNEVTITVNKGACPSYTAPSAKSGLVYNGSSQTLYNAGSSSNGTFSYSSGSRTAAGSQTVSWTFTPTDSCRNGASGSFTGTIAQKAISIPTPTGVSRAYNGSAAAATFGSATGAGITKYRYSTNGSSWTETTSNPSQTNAGTLYTQAYYSANNDNYSGAGWSSSATISISKANQSAPTATGATTTYPTGATATASGGGGQGTLTWTNGSSRSSCGSQDTYAYWAGNSNYNASPNSNKVTITVNKGACPSYTAPTAKTGLVYNGSSQTLYNAGSSSNGTFSYSNGTRTAAGSQTVSWTFTPTDSCRNGASGSFSVTIAQKAISIPTPTGVSRAYNGSAASATFGSATGAGITKYRYSTNGSSWTESSTNPSQTNAGTLYTQAYYSANNDNYSGAGWSSSATIAISKANQSAPTATGATTTYNTTATATASGGGGQGSIEWSNGNTQTSVGSKTTKARWSGNSNYNASPWSSEVTVQMNKAAGSVSTAPTNSNPTYGSGGYLCTAGSGTGTMLYKLGSGSYSSTRPTTSGLNAESYTLYYKASASTNYNESSEASITVTVAKASQSAPTATGAEVCYGNTATASASGGGGQGSIEWSNGNSRTAVGSQTTKARWSGNSNYNASSYSSEVTLKVTATWCSGTTWSNNLTWPSA